MRWENNRPPPTIKDFDNKVSEADAYLQLMIEQTKVAWLFLYSTYLQTPYRLCDRAIYCDKACERYWMDIVYGLWAVLHKTSAIYSHSRPLFLIGSSCIYDWHCGYRVSCECEARNQVVTNSVLIRKYHFEDPFLKGYHHTWYFLLIIIWDDAHLFKQLFGCAHKNLVCNSRTFLSFRLKTS